MVPIKQKFVGSCTQQPCYKLHNKPCWCTAQLNWTSQLAHNRGRSRYLWADLAWPLLTAELYKFSLFWGFVSLSAPPFTNLDTWPPLFTNPAPPAQNHVKGTTVHTQSVFFLCGLCLRNFAGDNKRNALMCYWLYNFTVTVNGAWMKLKSFNLPWKIEFLYLKCVTCM